MKTIKITTHWTTEQADDIYALLDDLKSAIWQSYGEDIVNMHREIAHQSLKEEKSRESKDNTLF